MNDKVKLSEVLIGLRSDSKILCDQLADRIEREGIAPPDGMVLVSVVTLQWWAELAEINPKDLPPRIEAMLAAAPDMSKKSENIDTTAGHVDGVGVSDGQ